MTHCNSKKQIKHQKSQFLVQYTKGLAYVVTLILHMHSLTSFNIIVINNVYVVLFFPATQLYSNLLRYVVLSLISSLNTYLANLD